MGAPLAFQMREKELLHIATRKSQLHDLFVQQQHGSGETVSITHKEHETGSEAGSGDSAAAGAAGAAGTNPSSSRSRSRSSAPTSTSDTSLTGAHVVETAGEAAAGAAGAGNTKRTISVQYPWYSYTSTMHPQQGLLVRYLELAQLAARIGDVLFVHGGIHDHNFG
jgi:hypothetical protein